MGKGHNLLCNAIRQTPSGGTIDVKASSDAVSACPQVTDDGSGFDWTRVKRTSVSALARDTGAGLVLRFVLRVAARHGAALRFSNRPNGGACAQITLTLRAVDGKHNTSVATSRAPAALP